MDQDERSQKGNEPCSIRLHIGGLGPSVTSSDMERTFATLGRVCSVEMVRTKDRNFAYMDFEAASPKDLQRLLSLYNGCMWKGGRLRLEKAREHYLDRLRREWAGNVERLDALSEQSDISTSGLEFALSNSTPSKFESSEGFKIFFPRQKKVKQVPVKGLGKHKRSFERVDVVPVSCLQVCDCDHCCRKSSNDQGRMTVRQEISPQLDNDIKEPAQNVEEKDDEEMQKSISKLAQEADKSSERPKKRVRFALNTDGSVSAERKEEGSNTDPKSNERGGGVGTSWVQKASWKALVGETGRIAFSLGNILGQRLESPVVNINQSDVLQLTTDLHPSFSASNGTGFMDSKPKVQAEKGTLKLTEEASVQKNSHFHLQSSTSGSRRVASLNRHDLAVGVREFDSHSMVQAGQIGQINSTEGKRHIGVGTSRDDIEMKVARPTDLAQPSFLVDGNDKVCTFMRSANSEQEWLESKRMVKEIVKTRRKEAMRSIKMLRIPMQRR